MKTLHRAGTDCSCTYAKGVLIIVTFCCRCASNDPLRSLICNTKFVCAAGTHGILYVYTQFSCTAMTDGAGSNIVRYDKFCNTLGRWHFKRLESQCSGSAVALMLIDIKNYAVTWQRHETYSTALACTLFFLLWHIKSPILQWMVLDTQTHYVPVNPPYDECL